LMIDKVVCENCGQDLAFIESEKEIRLSDKAIIAVLGVTTDGEISGTHLLELWTCEGLQPLPFPFEANQTFTSNRKATLGGRN